MRNLYLFYYLL